MNEEFVNIEYSPIWNFQYSSFFRDTQYNGKTLSDDERKEFVATIDKTVAMKSEGLPMMFEILEDSVGKTDIFNEVYRTVVSMMQFVLITSIDSMVMAKYFLLADKDYDRRLMRGKMLVILNEGFKRLYGFDEKTCKKSVWSQLLGYMKFFPEIIKRQYHDLTALLEKQAKSSSWWREERNLETHMVTEELYKSRQEDIVESKVMMDSMKLFNSLLAVDHFLTNVHSCLRNQLVAAYRRGDLKE